MSSGYIQTEDPDQPAKTCDHILSFDKSVYSMVHQNVPSNSLSGQLRPQISIYHLI